MADGYKRVIGWALDHRKTVVRMAFAAFVGGLGVFGILQAEFQTPMDQGEFLMKFKSAPGSSIAETRGRLEEVLKAPRGVQGGRVHLRVDRRRRRGHGPRRDGVREARAASTSARAASEQFIHDARLRLAEDARHRALGAGGSGRLPEAAAGRDPGRRHRHAEAVRARRSSGSSTPCPASSTSRPAWRTTCPSTASSVDRERAAASGLGSGGRGQHGRRPRRRPGRDDLRGRGGRGGQRARAAAAGSCAATSARSAT